jgi:peroxiredoxin
MDAENFADGEASLKPRVSVSAALAVSALAVFTIFITWRARVLEVALEQPLNVHLLAPDFRATKMDGTPVSLSDFRGKKVVLTFWASWCGPCQEEMGALNSFYQAHHTASSRFEILGVSIDEDVAQAARFAGEKDLTFPILLDPRETIARAYEEKGVPTLFVINAGGSIDYAHVGFDRSDRLEQILARDLGINLDRPMGSAR